MVTITGPAARSPINATISGTPMKPVLGKAATRAPKAASFRPMPAATDHHTVADTISSAHTMYSPSHTGLTSCANGVLAPKRNSMQGSAKKSTKMLSPVMADSGSTRWRAAT